MPKKRRVQSQDMRQDPKYGYKKGYAIAPDGEPYFGYHPETGRPICAGKNVHPTRLGDHVCLRTPLKGKLRCKRHFGNAPSGTEHPRFETGEHIQKRYSNVGSLGKMIEEHLEDPDFLSSQSEIAAFRSRLEELMVEVDKIKAEDMTLAPRLARRAYNLLQASLASGSSEGFTQGMTLLSEALHRDEAVRERWDEMRDVAATIDRFVGREMALEKIAQGYISNTDFVLFMKYVQNAILALGLTDEQKGRFQNDIAQLMMSQQFMSPIQALGE